MKRTLLTACLLLALAPGCALLPGRPGAIPAKEGIPYPGVFAEVVKVGPDANYVILECLFSPGAETEARVFRNGRVVGRVALTRWVRRQFVVANILEGEPEIGDFIRP